jgi:hypothetical protein
MSSQVIGVPQHPVAAFAERLNTRLDDVGQMGLTTMSPAEKRGTLVALAQSKAKTDALYLRCSLRPMTPRHAWKQQPAMPLGSSLQRLDRADVRPDPTSSWPSGWSSSRSSPQP